MLFFIQGCVSGIPKDYLAANDYSSTKVYKASYKSIETALTNVINIKDITPNAEGGTDYNPDGGFTYADLKYRSLGPFLSNSKTYGKSVHMKPLYFVSEYILGKKLVANNNYNTCNIYCTGYAGVLFHIEELTKDTTSVKVNYYDYVYTFNIFPTIKKGYDEEQYIHKLLFNSYVVIQQ